MKKRLLFLNSTLGCGGVERSLCDVLRHIDYDKYEVCLYLDSTEGGLFAQVPDNVTIVHPNLDGCYGHFSKIVKDLARKREFAKLWLRLI